MIGDDTFFIIEAVHAAKNSLAGTTWYLFGSVVNGGKSCSDIDILVVYDRQDAIAKARACLTNFMMAYPIHLTFISRDEEGELGFICSENCVEFFPARRVG
ncbi:MAG: nucleotidyltransferase domain-containing protein [Magnetospirillum sp.]|nr:nucleotidyltransferase domain-containing protein [Magnetospirillum sp.]